MKYGWPWIRWTTFAFDKAGLDDGAIEKKYKELMAIAVALTTQCPCCMEIHKQADTHGTHLFDL